MTWYRPIKYILMDFRSLEDLVNFLDGKVVFLAEFRYYWSREYREISVLFIFPEFLNLIKTGVIFPYSFWLQNWAFHKIIFSSFWRYTAFLFLKIDRFWKIRACNLIWILPIYFTSYLISFLTVSVWFQCLFVLRVGLIFQ